MDPNERVMVVPTELLHRLGYFQGFTANIERYLPSLFAAENISYRLRGEAEKNPDFKQLIPYVIFRYAAADDVELFQYTRGSGQGEGRLHRKRSIGIGGHISSLDAGEQTGAYREGMKRELDEEVAINAPFQDRCVGLINDDETDVGRVHLGVVHLFEMDSPHVTPRESEIVDAGFRPLDQLMADLSSFESWSAICLKTLFADQTPQDD